MLKRKLIVRQKDSIIDTIINDETIWTTQSQ
jgi:hypothetical protein